MTQEIKNEIKSRCERNIFSFGDIKCHKRDIISYVRELGYDYSYALTNINVKNIDWNGYEEIVRKGVELPNYNLARVIREVKALTKRDFAKRTFQYKLKELGVRVKDINKLSEQDYYLAIMRYSNKYGREQALKHYGIDTKNVEFTPYDYSIAELCVGLQLPLDLLYKRINDNYSSNPNVIFINNCKFKDSYRIGLAYSDFKKFNSLHGITF